MHIEHAEIPMGPESGRRVLELLQLTLSPDAPTFPQLVREVAYRVDRDLGRLPWTEGVLEWLGTQHASVYQVLLQHLF